MTPKLRNTFLMASSCTVVAAGTYMAGSMGYIAPDYHNMAGHLCSASGSIAVLTALKGAFGYMQEKKKIAEIEEFQNALRQMAKNLKEEREPGADEIKRPLNETDSNPRPNFPHP